jgi:hypothetical protein
MSPLTQILSLSLLFAGSVQSLEVTPGSSCAALCLDEASGDRFDPESSSTNSTDIACHDRDFANEDTGIKFKTCLECLQKSEKANETESDLHWYIYNMRYTLSSCLFSVPAAVPDPVDSPCVINYACGYIQEAITTGQLNSVDRNTFSYCDVEDGVFGKKLQSCVNCLRASNDETYLANFVTTLQAGCVQRPEPGSLVSVTGDVFSAAAVNVTEPTENILDRPEGAGSGTFTTGTIVGIAVGVGLLLLAAVALFIVHWRRQRRFRNTEKNDVDYHGDHAGTPDPILPPKGSIMTASLRTHSGQSTYKDQPHITTTAATTAGEYYDKVEEDLRTGRLNYNFDPRSRNRGANSAFPAHQAYIPQTVSRLSTEASNGHTSFSSQSSSLKSWSRPTAPTKYAVNQYITSVELPATNTAPSPPRPIHIAQAARPPPQPRPTAPAAMPLVSATILPPPPSRQKSSVPSLVLPSVGKLRLPKKYAPPNLSGTPTTTASSQTQQQAAPKNPEIQISPPVMSQEGRFHDRPLGGGVIYAADATNIEAGQDLSPERANNALKSGHSLLYG